jgi:peptidyl-prolyl cis-trans isomerase D
MFHILRRAAQTWVAKLLMLLLVASFGIWGVSHSAADRQQQHDGRDRRRSACGRQRIPPRLSAPGGNLSQQFGMRLTPEQARAFGVEQQVLAQLVAGASLDQLADDMNLGLSEDRLAQLIGDDPAFKAVNGQFDRSLFTRACAMPASARTITSRSAARSPSAARLSMPSRTASRRRRRWSMR